MTNIALTDRGQYAPSLEATATYANAPIDMHLYPGEEVQAPNNNILIINKPFRSNNSSEFNSPIFSRSAVS